MFMNMVLEKNEKNKKCKKHNSTPLYLGNGLNRFQFEIVHVTTTTYGTLSGST